MTIVVSPNQTNLLRGIAFGEPNGKIMKSTPFTAKTFYAYAYGGQQIVHCRIYPEGESHQGGQETIFSDWDSGITFRVNNATSSTISGQFNDQFDGEVITHIPKGATTRMFMEYETVPVYQQVEVPVYAYPGGPQTGTEMVDFLDENGQKVQIGTEEVPQGERPMTDSEFSAEKAKNPEIVRPTITNGTSHVPPDQEILAFTADSNNSTTVNITVEVGYVPAGEDPETHPLSYHYETMFIPVNNDLNSLLTWINNYMETYAPFVPPNPEG